MTDPYSDTVRELFSDLQHAGDLTGSAGSVQRSHSGSRAAGAEIELAAAVADGTIRELRFKAFGCPYLLAALEYCCRSLRGKPLAAAAALGSGELVEALTVPQEKTGIILLVEDALRSLHED